MRFILLLWGCLSSLLLIAQTGNNSSNMVSEDLPNLSLTRGSQSLSDNVTATTKYVSYSNGTLSFSVTIENTGDPETFLKVITTNLKAVPGLRANSNGHDIGRPEMNGREELTVSAGRQITLTGRLNTTLEDVRLQWGDNIQSYTNLPTPPNNNNNTPQKPSMVSEGLPALSLLTGSQALSDNVTALTKYVNTRSNAVSFIIVIENTGSLGTFLQVKTTGLTVVPGLRADKNGHEIGLPEINSKEYHTVASGQKLTLTGQVTSSLNDIRLEWGDNIQSYTTNNSNTTNNNTNNNNPIIPPTPNNNNNQRPPVTNNNSNNNYSGRKNCSTPSGNTAYFEQLKKQILEELTDFNKIDVAKQGLKGHCFTTAQIMELIEIFSFDNSKLQLAKAAFSSTYDAENYHKVVELLTFSSKKRELEAFIK